ncbi:hypothetical protein BSNK01_23810 [Bacillaceae bacterium]
MTAMPVIIIAGLGLFAVGMAIWPFLAKNVQTSSHPQKTGPWEGEQEKEQVFMQLSDLEYDYQMGKVAKEDYEQAKEELTAKAARLIAAEKENRERIEREVDEEIARYLQQQSVAASRKDEKNAFDGKGAQP